VYHRYHDCHDGVCEEAGYGYFVYKDRTGSEQRVTVAYWSPHGSNERFMCPVHSNTTTPFASKPAHCKGTGGWYNCDVATLKGEQCDRSTFAELSPGTHCGPHSMKLLDSYDSLREKELENMKRMGCNTTTGLNLCQCMCRMTLGCEYISFAANNNSVSGNQEPQMRFMNDRCELYRFCNVVSGDDLTMAPIYLRGTYVYFCFFVSHAILPIFSLFPHTFILHCCCNRATEPAQEACKAECLEAGIGSYSMANSNTRRQCPAGSNTTSATASSVDDCKGGGGIVCEWQCPQDVLTDFGCERSTQHTWQCLAGAKKCTQKCTSECTYTCDNVGWDFYSPSSSNTRKLCPANSKTSTPQAQSINECLGEAGWWDCHDNACDIASPSPSPGYFSVEGSNGRWSCPKNSETDDEPHAASVGDCLANAGYFGQVLLHVHTQHPDGTFAVVSISNTETSLVTREGSATTTAILTTDAEGGHSATSKGVNGTRTGIGYSLLSDGTKIFYLTGDGGPTITVGADGKTTLPDGTVSELTRRTVLVARAVASTAITETISANGTRTVTLRRADGTHSVLTPKISSEGQHVYEPFELLADDPKLIIQPNGRATFFGGEVTETMTAVITADGNRFQSIVSTNVTTTATAQTTDVDLLPAVKLVIDASGEGTLSDGSNLDLSQKKQVLTLPDGTKARFSAVVAADGTRIVVQPGGATITASSNVCSMSSGCAKVGENYFSRHRSNKRSGCPEHSMTDTEMAISRFGCLGQPGWFHCHDGSCNECGEGKFCPAKIGTYSSPLSIEPPQNCPLYSTTTHTTASSISECVGNEGWWACEDGECDEASLGYFSEKHSNERHQCPAFSTTSSPECSSMCWLQRQCMGIGGFYNCGNGVCSEAGIGFYSEPGSNSRRRCPNPSFASTETTVATSTTDCIGRIVTNEEGEEGGYYRPGEASATSYEPVSSIQISDETTITLHAITLHRRLESVRRRLFESASSHSHRHSLPVVHERFETNDANARLACYTQSTDFSTYLSSATRSKGSNTTQLDWKIPASWIQPMGAIVEDPAGNSPFELDLCCHPPCTTSRPTTAPTTRPSSPPTAPSNAPTAVPSTAPTVTPTASPTATTCDDGKKTGTETDIDCGGSCNGCSVGKGCVVNNDCMSHVCTGRLCNTPSPTPTPTTFPTPSPGECVVSIWGVWSQCSMSCGGGVMSHERRVLAQPVFGGRACPTLRGTMACNSFSCPINCVVGGWSRWGECNALCDGGSKMHSREVTTPMAYAGVECPALLEMEICNTHPCPVDCQISSWQQWSACTKSCGGGSSHQSRSIIITPSGGGMPCPSALSNEAECNTFSCPSNCVLTEWSGFSKCTVMCSSGTKMRTRQVVSSMGFGGTHCPPLTDTQGCNTQPCFADCQVSAWSAWTDCSHSCGSGDFRHSRSIIIMSTHGGLPCPILQEEMECNTHR
jgi:hypothetical protein